MWEKINGELIVYLNGIRLLLFLDFALIVKDTFLSSIFAL